MSEQGLTPNAILEGQVFDLIAKIEQAGNEFSNSYYATEYESNKEQINHSSLEQLQNQTKSALERLKTLNARLNRVLNTYKYEG